MCTSDLTGGLTPLGVCSKSWRAVYQNIIKFGLVRPATRSFLAGISRVCKVSTIAAVLNALLKLYTGLLGLHVRDKLTAKAHELLMQRMNYYKANWVGKDRVINRMSPSITATHQHSFNIDSSF